MNETFAPMRELDIPLARDLAEMMLTHRDLTNSLASLTLWSQSFTSNDQSPDKAIIEGSLFRDGITQFVGCFDSKNAVPLVVETVYPNMEGIDVYFRWLRALRNSYTAHRHGAARQCVVGAFIDPSGKYLGWSNFFANYTGPEAGGHPDLLRAVTIAISHVEARIATMIAEFEAAARTLSPEQLLKLPTARIEAQGPTTMSKSRGDVRADLARKRTNAPE